ncbi:hypothetical protein JX265_010319 [Neoarthrinium moseri]|uniref:Uncharacterized protein n=1 Tax=Neoarthrinium moseri TaxID=1658444 RepID=A0A9P9WF03_9PEZI|nr:hypothetical protein JX265_010319 [Neoarthrinium moseri]
MSNHGADTSRPAHPLRPRHRMSRSVTETSAPRLHRHHNLLPQRRHQDRTADRLPQSAVPALQLPMRGSLDLPRSEGVTPYLVSSAEQSRRASALPPGAEEIGANAPDAAHMNTEMQAQRRREQAASRTAGLKKSLTGLSEFSLSTTRRLDDAYYAVLERLSMLQNTIVGIKEVAAMSQETNEIFKVDSRGLVTEIETQLDGLGQFDEQQKRIESLQERIHVGRQKAQKLSDRVDIVRGRVEGWERADREWQEKTRRRLKTLWIITSVLALVVIAILLGSQYAPDEVGTLGGKLSEMMSGNNSSHLGEAGAANSSRLSEHLGEDVRAALNRTRGDGPSVDERVLRAFDEL